MYFTPLAEVLQQAGKGSRIYNLTGSSAALFLALTGEPFLAVELTDERAEEISRDINFFRDILKKPRVLFIPEPDGPSASGTRAQKVRSFVKKDSLVCSFRNLASVTWTPESIERTAFTLQQGMHMNRASLEERLIELGYRNVPVVSEKGEYRRREWLFDIFPSTLEYPLRIEFFGDEIDSMRKFDVDSQRSSEHISHFTLFPASEPRQGIPLGGLMEGKTCFFSDSIEKNEEIPPDVTFLCRYSFEGEGINAGLRSLKGLGLLPEEREHIEELPRRISVLQKDDLVRIISSSERQAERLRNIFRDSGMILPLIENTELFTYEGRAAVTVGELSSGFFLPGMILLTEKEIFGGRPGYRPIKKSNVSHLLTSLDDLSPGNFVVHRDHGIGQFTGLVRQKIEGTEQDLMIIEYDGGRLYVPLQGINTIHTYHAEDGIIPRIDRLGGKTWQKTKRRVQKKIHEIAQKLLSIYAAREVGRGFVFSPDSELHREFDSFFPYEETPDQLNAISEIKQDMESQKPMDRLICGDVGYGKTEVAMRAAFKAVYDGTQVAMLVPTTILCEQHFRTFKTRFSGFPITIDYLSRFKPKKEQPHTLKALSDGEIDILIGTHGLLGNKVTFQNLGLLIVDEEHRFGVRQKEKIKELKKGVDVITLTATPIPRTLSMALSRIRDMSIIETPPEERLAVKSIVSHFDPELIKDALRREIERDGQIFFVHNRIQNIFHIAEDLMKIYPGIRVAVAHGQMAEKQLEHVMLLFYEHKIDLLVSTAIIGSGLDIPTANTILINRADRMGLADLYQLRGRVGRGNVKAYSYFLIPGDDRITEDARKRLQAIQEMSYLGAGFRLAMKDLEIRGAGNMLGAQQSGHIHAVGFDLYVEMLEKTVAELKGQPVEEQFEPVLRLRMQAFIPEDYVDDVTLRLSLYRRIANANTEDILTALKDEIQDRFGKIPEGVRNLLRVMKIKLFARDLLIREIQDSHGRVTFLFSPDTRVNPESIFRAQLSRKEKMRFLPEGFQLLLQGKAFDSVFHEITTILVELKESLPLHE
jgi:transcription-repair coupling factor (superfamily II helicase)